MGEWNKKQKKRNQKMRTRMSRSEKKRNQVLRA
jgi:hypothetical protein